MTNVELDTAIAEKVFGLKVVHKTWNKGKCHSYSIGEPDYYDDQGAMILSNPLPCYSTDIAMAWEVVGFFDKSGGAMSYSSMKNGIRGHFITLSYLKNPVTSRMDYVMVEAETAPKAICLAALKALENKNG
jgi:hypothetical protein